MNFFHGPLPTYPETPIPFQTNITILWLTCLFIYSSTETARLSFEYYSIQHFTTLSGSVYTVQSKATEQHSVSDDYFSSVWM